MGVNRGIKELVEDANKVVKTLTTESAIKCHGDKDFIFIDIRDVRELEREGMIPNSFHAPRGMLEFWVDPKSPYHKEIFAKDDKTYILYCQSAWRSALATKTLLDMGMKNVRHFSDGFSGWKNAGGPVEIREKKI